MKPDTRPWDVRARECLSDHILYNDCHHDPLDDCCCTCEAKRLLGRTIVEERPADPLPLLKGRAA